MAARARELTDKPFGVNLLLSSAQRICSMLRSPPKPAVLSTAWARQDQDLAAIFARAHESGAKVMHMVATARRGGAGGGGRSRRRSSPRAQRAEGHVGEMGTTVIVRPGREGSWIRCRSSPPAASATARGLAAALALGATASCSARRSSPRRRVTVPDWYKQAIVDSDGHDTVVTTVADTYSGRDWPGAWGRVLRTPMIEEWLGREPELRRRRTRSAPSLRRRGRTRRRTPGRSGPVSRRGSSTRCCPPGDVVRQIVAEAEQILRSLP